MYDYFRSLLGKTSYVWSRPWWNFISSSSATATRDDVDTVIESTKRLNKAVEAMQLPGAPNGPRFRKLDISKPLMLVLFVDASFANLKLRTQGGYSIWLANADKHITGARKIGKVRHRDRSYGTRTIRACWIKSASRLVRRVCNSTLQAETLSALQGYDT